MKNYIFLILALFISLSAYQQESIELEFNIVQEGSVLQLDSILIENITRSLDTSIYYPDNRLLINITSNINILSLDGNIFEVFPNYPNPVEDKTEIKIFLPETELLSIKIMDSSGRLFDSYQQGLKSGYHIFSFYPGSAQNYVLSFTSGNITRSTKVVSSSNHRNRCKIEYMGESFPEKNKSIKNNDFIFISGDELKLTAYVTACNEVESVSISDNPVSSREYDFNFTHLTNLTPEAPITTEIIKEENSITWQWNLSANVHGYKYNFVNDYETAIDNGLNVSLMQDNLIAGTNYQLYVWAYNDCGLSSALEINAATSALPLTQDETDLILEGEAGIHMTIMNIFEQPDSIILRTPSTNIIFGEEHIDHFVSRLQRSGIHYGGVGIAAPQVGINRRIIWVKRYDQHPVMAPWKVYYNPRITEYSDTVVLRNDGCLSVPTGSQYPETDGFSYRAIWVTVEYTDTEGEIITERINHTYTAHIFQHEIDHLDGIMFFDRQQLEEKIPNYIIIEDDSY